MYGDSQYIQFLGLSENGGKITLIRPGNPGTMTSQNNPLIDEIVVTPLFNSRVIPLFFEHQLIHPIVPIVDEKRGYTVVFALNIDQTLTTSIGNNNEYYNSDYKCTHTNSKYYRWAKLFNLNPGLIIRHFNGVEQKIPIKERFLRVNRFVMSKDGH